MTSESDSKFAIRHNSDGSLDAICLQCFATAGTAINESELPAIERAHECDPRLLLWLNRSSDDPEHGTRVL